MKSSGAKNSVKAPNRDHFLRPSRHFEEDYPTEGLTKRVQQNYCEGVRTKPRPELHPRVNRKIREQLKDHNSRSLATRHYRYYLLLAAYSVIPLSDQAPNLRAETQVMEAILRQTMMLLEYAIETIEELLKFKKSQEQKLTPLQKERAKLYKIVAKSSDNEKVTEAKEQLKDIRFELKAIRLVIRDCEAIENRGQTLDRQIMSITLKKYEEKSR